MLELQSTWDPQNRLRKIPYIDEHNISLFYNKATVFYWTQLATVNVWRKGPTILGGIWNAWSAALGRKPRMELDEFFAIPVMGSYERMSTFAFNSEKPRKRTMEPDYAIPNRPLFNECKLVAAEKHATGFRHCDDVARAQSILLVRTGQEDGLSAFIDFRSLKDKAPPLARNDNIGTIDVSRVLLQVGVQFVASLLQREEVAFPDSVMTGPHISEEQGHPFMKWERQAHEFVKERMAQAQERGKITHFMTLADLRKVYALTGRIFIP
ncbi:hypothetical protein LSUE1_G007265 [Lachnellula suecica]|uniref:Uncharacterized protein n=1 Tax=Lachnellula suecica TaxID=602035 RepID=A0A8T9BWW2_9HELO|nr:hypothetical protein LSUE1_G007265 [Lachnellula suecica]